MVYYRVGSMTADLHQSPKGPFTVQTRPAMDDEHCPVFSKQDIFSRRAYDRVA